MRAATLRISSLQSRLIPTRRYERGQHEGLPVWHQPVVAPVHHLLKVMTDVPVSQTTAQTARTSARRLIAYSSSQQTAAAHADQACAAMSCAYSSRLAALWGSTRSRSGTSTCDSSQSINATRSAVM